MPEIIREIGFGENVTIIAEPVKPEEMTTIINVLYVKIIYSFSVIKQKTMAVFLVHVMKVAKVMDVINQTQKILKIWKKCVHALKIAKHAKVLIYVMFVEILGYCLQKEQVAINLVLFV